MTKNVSGLTTILGMHGFLSFNSSSRHSLCHMKAKYRAALDALSTSSSVGKFAGDRAFLLVSFIPNDGDLSWRDIVFSKDGWKLIIAIALPLAQGYCVVLAFCQALPLAHDQGVVSPCPRSDPIVIAIIAAFATATDAFALALGAGLLDLPLALGCAGAAVVFLCRKRQFSLVHCPFA